jgi:hypothetical protein
MEQGVVHMLDKYHNNKKQQLSLSNKTQKYKQIRKMKTITYQTHINNHQTHLLAGQDD